MGSCFFWEKRRRTDGFVFRFCCLTVCCLPDGSDTRYTRWTYDRTYDRTVITDTAPGKIVSGSGMRLSAHTLNNSDSHILAGGALEVTADALNNHETQGILTYTDSGESQYFWYHNSKYSIHTCSDSPVAFSRDPVSTSIGLGTVKFAANQEGAASSTQIGSASSLTLPGNSLFAPSPDVTAGYLVETNPRFTDYRNWISSDYMLAQLGIDPAAMMKRLGDGFYEQRLVQEQVAQLTGRRFLEGYASNEQQYQDLLTNGVTVAQAWDLRPGVALTDTQIARLTSDIVWLVEKEVTLPNGETTRALVPQLYLMPREGDLTGAGALIAGNTLNLKLSGNLANQGTVAGREVVAITADNISNTGGRITGETVGLLAEADINNTGGIIDAVNRLEATAGGNIHVASTTVGSQDGSRTDIDRVAGLYITGSADGVMLAHAGRDMTISGAVVSNNSEGGMTVLTAGNDINLGTVATRESVSFKASGIRRQESSETQTGSTLAAKGEVQLVAGHDLTAKGAAIATEKGDITLAAGNNINLTTATQTATVHEDMKRGKKSGFSNGDYALESGTAIQSGEGSIKMLAGHDVNARGAYVASEQAAVNVAAGNDVNLTASADHVFQDKYFRVKKKGVLSKKTTTTYDVAETLTSQGSVISGNTMEILAGNDVNIQGSHAVSDYGTGIYAGHDIHIAAATDSAYENHYKKVKKSGVMGGGGLGVTIGSQAQSLDRKDTRYTASASTVGSTDGNVSLVAGNRYTQEGSHVMSPAGDVYIAAKQADIVEARNAFSSQSEYKFKKSGLTVSLSNPVVSFVQTASAMKEAVKDSEDSRMTALAAANVALAGWRAYQAVDAGRNESLAKQAGGIDVAVSIGSSKSSSKSTARSNTASGSTVSAGGDISIIAAGGNNSNLTVRGSDLVAGNNLSLVAENQLALLAAQSTAEQHSANKSSSGSIGVSMGTSGFGVTVAGSRGKGKADGSDLVWNNTHLEAGKQLTLSSGGDISLSGAVARAEQIVAYAGGNLNITSLQDVSTYDSRQKSTGGSLTVGAGGITGGSVSHSRSQISSDYASVVEQSGLRAGDGGFQVEVGGHTSLEGGAITSTQKAIDENRNTFHTGGDLALSDIQNEAAYEGKALGVNLGAVPSMDGSLTPGSSSAGVGSASGSASSTTQAAISGVAGNTAARTGDEESGLARIFDAGKVQKNIDAQVKIMQKFNELAPVAAADYAARQAKKLRSEAIEALPFDSEKADELVKEAKKWEHNGKYQIAMNIIIAAIGGGETGAALGTTKEGLSWAADQMRQAMIADSWKAKPFCDANGTCISNISGHSQGVYGDGIKLGGGRIDPDELCKTVTCGEPQDGVIKLTYEGKDITWDEILEMKPELVSPLGGVQGYDGMFLGRPYEPGDFRDKLVEAYAGTHDYLNSSVWYGPDGNVKPGMTEMERNFGEIHNIVNVPLATPFALSVLLPPGMWNAIGTALWGN